MQIIKLFHKDGIYSCNMNITKQEWLKILKDKNTPVEFKESIIHFYYMPERNYTYLAAIKKEDYHVLELATEEAEYSYNNEETQKSKSGMEFTEAIKEYLRFPPTNKSKSEMKKINKYDKYIELLKANKNLILTGAPGTGKTFMAKEIAKAFILSKINDYDGYKDTAGGKEHFQREIFNYHSMMVQFHPSYDYADFVEGLRPEKYGDGQLSFKRVDGVFKAFCKHSFQRYVTRRKVDNVIISIDKDYNSACWGDELYYICYNEAMKEIMSNNSLRNPETGKHFDGLTVVDGRIKDVYSNWIDFFFESEDIFYHTIGSDCSIFSSMPFTREEILDGLISRWNEAVQKNYMWESLNPNYDINSNKNRLVDFYEFLFNWIVGYAKRYYYTESLPTIFIIDEINRGEISKIFGELFFSIDLGYRGEYDANGNDNKVQTQYQNMIDDGDVFKDGFYVPENVYIIGTMNDIDRSVEDMDFAMQRRFATVEVKAEESFYNMIADSKDFSEDEKTEIKERMSALNNAILEPDLGLGAAYQIGAAYFLKYLNYKKHGMKQAFAMLWNYHLKGLLSEYLRGNHNSKAQLEALKEAYDNKIIKHEESNQDNG